VTALSLGRAATDPIVGARAAVVASGVEHTYRELGARAARVRAALARAGVTQGSRVAVVATNDVETVAIIHALIDLGATFVPTHPRLTPGEAAALVADASPRLTVDRGTALVEGGDPPPVCDHDVALPLAILYTSGTTGRPKGAVLSRRAFLANAAASDENLGFRDGDRWLLCMPVCHVGGLSILVRCLLAGRTVIVEPRFEPDAVLATITRSRATILSVVPTMLAALLERDQGGALARLRAVLVGGAGAPFALLEECERRGIPALTTYGLTEACSQVTVQRLVEPYRASRGSGQALSGVDVRVAHTIQVRGPTLMDGYFAGPDVPLVDPRDADGWFDTGDLGELSESGTLFVHARRTDLIVTGGENVYPVEVEQALEALPGVRRALVFGVPDERWGQIVAAALELLPGATLDAIGEQVAAVLAKHKRPRLACAVDAVPLTTSGKLVRAGAAERYAPSLRALRVVR
jgi:O-succinylbenzoic acid--CoA ligase